MSRKDTVFLGGTTAGTAWRRDLIKMLADGGIPESVIDNPHKPKGSGWSIEDSIRELLVIERPQTLVVMHLCPSVPNPDKYPQGTDLSAISQNIGPITMQEMDYCAHVALERTAYILNPGLFTNRRSSKVIEILTRRIEHIAMRQGAKPNIFTTLEPAAGWVIEQMAT